jgi:hypothetical protein
VFIPLLIALAPAAPVPKSADLPRIVCTVERTPIPAGGGRVADDGLWVEVTLTNRTGAPITVSSRDDLRDRLYARTTDSTGKEVSNPVLPYINDSIVIPERTYEIAPGGKECRPLHLLWHTVKPGHKPKPGKYTVTVVFESGTIRSAAAPIEVEVK